MSSADGLRNRKSGATRAAAMDSSDKSSGNGADSTGPRSAMSAAQVAKDEKRKLKLIVQVISSFAMISVFGGCVYMGHLYVCGVVAEVLLFQELVKV